MKHKVPILFSAYFLIALIPFLSAHADESASIAAFSKSAVIGERLSFQTEDFTTRVTGGAALDGVIVCALPNPKVGVLKFAGRDVTPGEALTPEGLNGLTFLPTGKEAARATFTIVPVFASGGVHAPVEIAVNVLTEKNIAPAAHDVSLSTAKNIAIKGWFSATDADNDALTYTIMEQPTLGSVELYPGEMSAFFYTPYQDKTGKDQFTYTVTDAAGNVSAPATVKIRIERSVPKLTYADLDGTGVQYPAAKLAEKGTFIGETIGEQHFLYPNRTVSRREFVSMVLALMDAESPAAASSTGFSDNGNTPAWSRAIIASARANGIVQGSPSQNGAVFRPNDPVTHAEAAVMLNHALGLENATTAAFAPAWAAQATGNLISASILPPQCNTNKPLTRSDAVFILYNAMKK